MPEGDTVWRTARHLDQALSGHLLLESDIRVPAFATVDLAGLRVVGTVARGKHLLTRIGDRTEPGSGPAVTLHTHLKMEGSWHLYRKGSRWRRPGHQARVVLRTEGWTAVGFSLGVTEVIDRDEETHVVGHLGPDLLGADWDLDEAVRRLGSRPDRAIGEALLDQRNLAGIGNMYKSELCFLLGVQPWLPVRDVPDLPKLAARGKVVLESNKNRGAQTTTGDTRRGRQLWVYRRDGQPCRRCGSPIKIATRGPGEAAGGSVGAGQEADRRRESYWCPHCQPSREQSDARVC